MQNIMVFINSQDEFTKFNEMNVIKNFLEAKNLSEENIYYYCETRNSTAAFERCLNDLRAYHFDYMIAVNRQSISFFNDDIFLLKEVLDKTHTIFVDIEWQINYLVTDLLSKGSKKEFIQKCNYAMNNDVKHEDEESDTENKKLNSSIISRMFFCFLELTSFLINILVSIVMLFISFLMMLI